MTSFLFTFNINFQRPKFSSTSLVLIFYIERWIIVNIQHLTKLIFLVLYGRRNRQYRISILDVPFPFIISLRSGWMEEGRGCAHILNVFTPWMVNFFRKGCAYPILHGPTEFTLLQGIFVTYVFSVFFITKGGGGGSG